MKDNLRIMCSMLILLSSLYGAYLPIKNTYASTDIYDLICPFVEHKFDQRNPVQKPAQIKSESKLITECPNPVDYICGQTEEYPVGSNQYLGFPTVPPIRIEIGQKIAGIDEIEWHDICDSGIPEISTASNTEMVCRVVTDFPYICLDARFVNSGCSSIDSFYNYLKNFIDYENDLTTGEIDEATIWYHYVNWMSGFVPNVIKNSGKLRIILEVWDSDEMDEAIPSDTQAPNCGLENINRKGLVYRQVSSNKIFTMYNVIQNSEHALISGNMQEPSNYYIRAKYCYTWQVKGSVNSLFREKIICSAWTNCGPTFHTLSTSFETRSARVRVSRPRSYNTSTECTGDDGSDTYNCVHNPSRFYEPPIYDQSGIANPLPDCDKPCSVLYHDSSLPKCVPSTYSSNSLNNPTQTAPIDPYIPKLGGCTYIALSTYSSILMKESTCGKGCGCISTAVHPNSMLLGDYLNRYYDTKLKRERCFVRRNGICVTFTENSNIAYVLMPTYKIESNDTSDVYPKLDNKLCGSFRVTLESKCFVKFDGFYVPAKNLAMILGATMAYNSWEKNTDNTYVKGTMVGNSFVGTYKVTTLIWDSRARTLQEKLNSYYPVGNNGSESYKGDTVYNVSYQNQPDPFPVYNYMLSINDDYQIVALKTYPLVRNQRDRLKIAPNFTYSELYHTGIGSSQHEIKKENGNLIKDDLPRLFLACQPYGGIPSLLQKYRDIYGSFSPSCHFRCPICNSKLNGDIYSMHMFGRAFDHIGGESGFKAACSIMLDCPLNCVDLGTQNLKQPSDKRPNGLKWGALNPNISEQRINLSDELTSKTTFDQTGPYFEDHCWLGSVCESHFNPVVHGFYDIESEKICGRKPPDPPNDTVTPILIRGSKFRKGSLVQMETMPRDGSTWSHLNCWPPARYGWGDGYVVPSGKGYSNDCIPCP